MRFLAVDDSLSMLQTYARYAAARVRADEEVKALAPLVLDPLGRLLAMVAARNQAQDGLVDAEAVRDHELELLDPQILDLGRKAFAHFGSRDDEGYKRLFEVAPSLLTATAQKEREQVYGAFVQRAGAEETPEGLRPVVKGIQGAWKKLQLAQAGEARAQKALQKAEKDELDARQDLVDGYRRLHAQLTDRFPRDQARVERYFKKHKAAAKKPKAPAKDEKPEA